MKKNNYIPRFKSKRSYTIEGKKDCIIFVIDKHPREVLTKDIGHSQLIIDDVLYNKIYAKVEESLIMGGSELHILAQKITEKSIERTEGKYYTPEIEEFHVGFVYYQKHRNPNHRQRPDEPKGWCIKPFTIYNNISLIELDLKEERIMVKYLDLEDIRALGWRAFFAIQNEDKTKTEVLGYVSEDVNKEKYLLYLDKDGNIEIILNETIDPEEDWTQFLKKGGSKYNETLFKGFIKNKSELNKLMKQLKITV